MTADTIILERANPRHDFGQGARYSPTDPDIGYILKRLTGESDQYGQARLSERPIQALRDLGIEVETREWEA